MSAGGRPKKLYRYKRNKESLEVWFNGARVGNVSAPLLRLVAELSRSFGVNKVLAHLHFIKMYWEKKGFGVTSKQEDDVQPISRLSERDTHD